MQRELNCWFLIAPYRIQSEVFSRHCELAKRVFGFLRGTPARKHLFPIIDRNLGRHGNCFAVFYLGSGKRTRAAVGVVCDRIGLRLPNSI